MPIVAAVDRSERAASVIERASALAEDVGVDLHVVHVGEVGVPSPMGGYDPDRERGITQQQATQIASAIAREHADIGTFEPVGLVGDPAAALLEYSAAHDAAYIVVSARKRPPIGQAVFGSVTQSLLLHADRPVVAVPHETS